MDSLVYVTTVVWLMGAIQVIERRLVFFKIFLLPTNQEILRAPLRVRVKMCSILLKRGGDTQTQIGSVYASSLLTIKLKARTLACSDTLRLLKKEFSLI